MSKALLFLRRSREPVQVARMDESCGHTIADALAKATSLDAKREVALAFLAYALGALVALDGPEKAMEAAYRRVDAVIKR